MKNFLLVVSLLFSTNTYSQGIASYNAVTTSQTGGRFEIIQSQMQRRLTFKLDKFTGKVYQLVKTSEENSSWQEIPKNFASLDVVERDKINYQLFLGGFAVRDCFLLNINSGTTWQLVSDRKDNLSFENFE